MGKSTVTTIELGLMTALVAVFVVAMITLCVGYTGPRPKATDVVHVRGIEPSACYVLIGHYRDTSVCRYNLPDGLTCVYGERGEGTSPACFSTPKEE
jgi:hypothetical protein